MRRKLVLEVILLITLLLGAGVMLFRHFTVSETSQDEIQIIAYSDPDIIGVTCSKKARAIWDSVDSETKGRSSYRKGVIEEIAQKYSEKEMGSREIPEGLSSVVQKNIVEDCDVFTFFPKKGFDKTILYVHGGAYIMDIPESDFNRMDELAQSAHARVIMPRYKTIWHGTYKEAYALFTEVYKSILLEKELDSTRDPSLADSRNSDQIPDLIIMGESAGGGLALGFVEYLRQIGLPIPQKMLLLCPWVDATMTNPGIPDYEARDILLAPYGLAFLGSLWAGDISSKDYRISPIYGDFSRKMPDSLIMVGTEEIMFPDITMLYAKLKEAGNHTRMVIGEGSYHVFMKLDTPEAEFAWTEIYKFLEE